MNDAGHFLDVVCIYAGSDGRSRIADGRIALAQTERGSWSPPQPAAKWIASRGDPGAARDWHHGTRPVMSLVIRGEWEVQDGFGRTRRLGPGTVLAVLDTEGQGHRSRVTGEDGCWVIGIELGGEPAQLLLDVFGVDASGA